MAREHIPGQSSIWKRKPIASLNPQETALLVVDMQKFYLEPTSTNFCPAALDIIPNITALASAFRDVDAPVIWLRNIVGNKDIKSWSSFYECLTETHLSYRRDKLAKDGDGFQLSSRNGCSFL